MLYRSFALWLSRRAMDRLQSAFEELQASWRGFRDERGFVDADVAWSADAVDADLQRLVLSLGAFGIAHPSGNGHGSSERAAGSSCAPDVVCEIEHPDALPEKPWLGACGSTSDGWRASDALHAVCSWQDAQCEVAAVLRRYELSAVHHLRDTHRAASRKSLYFYVDFQLFVKLLQRGPVVGDHLAWYREKFSEWVLVMPADCRRGSGDDLRITMEAPGLYVS